MKALIEVCVDRLDSVQACADAGVDRIELCAALSEGGLTPSIGFLNEARNIFSGTIMMMIRPRAGDFLYSMAEIEVMMHDIGQGQQFGADGFVFGCLQADGEIDRALTARLCTAAASRSVTFHRAFDVTPDLPRSLETLINLGIPRVLTSGGACDVWQGSERLRALVEQAAGRITVLPGGGVTAERAVELLDKIQTNEIHLSARQTVASKMKFQRDDIPMGATQVIPETHHRIADANLLRALRMQLTQFS
jgi:copper homeostasis protein